jgi:dTMP kinase
MAQPVPKGTLIAIEGIDGSGKTTQAALLKDWALGLGFEVVATKEPTAGPWGSRIRNSKFTSRMSADEELDCFVRDRREHVEELLAPSLERGAVVIVDRYYFSTAAYQGARGLEPAAVLALNQAFAPRPDIVLLLDLAPEEGLQRVSERGAGRDLFESVEELTKARAIFLSLEEPRIVKLDATLGVVDLHARIIFELMKGPLQSRIPEMAGRLPAPPGEPDVDFLLYAQALTEDSTLTLEQKLALLHARGHSKSKH